MRQFERIFLVANCLLVAVVADDGDTEITMVMQQLEVVPDVIDEAPKEFLKVTFDSGVVADKGVELTPTQARHQPRVEWTAEADSLYTLILTDPDAPSRAAASLREWHNWLVVNIPGDMIEQGDVLTEYVDAGPPRHTGLHRYVFLLYRQPKRLECDENHLANNSADGRPNFSTRKFAAKYNLGNPIAGNLFQAQYDDYVPVVHKQVGFKI